MMQQTISLNPHLRFATCSAALKGESKMNPIELLNTVNKFYDQAFGRLLIITFGIVAFIGVVIPLAVGWLQSRSLRAEKNSLLNELKAELLSERSEAERKVTEEIKSQMDLFKKSYEERFVKIMDTIKESSASSTARAHHLQGNANIEEASEAFGISDFCHAASNFFASGEEDNARRGIQLITQTCLPKLDSILYKENNVEECCNKLIEIIIKHNGNSRYADDILSIKREMQKASTRARSRA
jgi:hemerythrin-like domain-containing protein